MQTKNRPGNLSRRWLKSMLLALGMSACLGRAPLTSHAADNASITIVLIAGPDLAKALACIDHKSFVVPTQLRRIG